MFCSICRKTGHNIRTCRALSAAKSEVISKRHELVIAESALAEIEKQWRYHQMKKSPDDAKKLQPGSSASSDSEFERLPDRSV